MSIKREERSSLRARRKAQIQSGSQRAPSTSFREGSPLTAWSEQIVGKAVHSHFALVRHPQLLVSPAARPLELSRRCRASSSPLPLLLLRHLRWRRISAPSGERSEQRSFPRRRRKRRRSTALRISSSRRRRGCSTMKLTLQGCDSVACSRLYAARAARWTRRKGKGEREREKERIRTGAYLEKREAEKGRKGRRAETAKSDRGTLCARKFLAIRGLMMPHNRAMLARDCSQLA